MWLMEEVTTNMGRDQKALRNLRLISPSGMAIKKVMNKTAKSAYHFVASGHSRNVIATAHIVIYKMSRKRDGSSHWNNFRINPTFLVRRLSEIVAMPVWSCDTVSPTSVGVLCCTPMYRPSFAIADYFFHVFGIYVFLQEFHFCSFGQIAS